MNLKYCRSTSLHLSPVDRRSFQLSIILPFVRASTIALYTRNGSARYGPFSPRDSFCCVFFFFYNRLSLFFSFSLSLEPSVGSMHQTVHSRIRVQRPYRIRSINTMTNRRKSRIITRLPIVISSSVNVERVIVGLSKPNR